MNHPHLELRGRVYAYRRKIPLDLHEAYPGRVEIRHSLKTRDRAVAVRLAVWTRESCSYPVMLPLSANSKVVDVDFPAPGFSGFVPVFHSPLALFQQPRG